MSKEDKKDRKKIDAEIISRMHAQGYTPEQIKIIARSSGSKDYDAIYKLPCKCSMLPELAECERCYLIYLEKLLNPTRIKGEALRQKQLKDKKKRKVS